MYALRHRLLAIQLGVRRTSSAFPHVRRNRCAGRGFLKSLLFLGVLQPIIVGAAFFRTESRVGGRRKVSVFKHGNFPPNLNC